MLVAKFLKLFVRRKIGSAKSVGCGPMSERVRGGLACRPGRVGHSLPYSWSHLSVVMEYGAFRLLEGREWPTRSQS